MATKIQIISIAVQADKVEQGMPVQYTVGQSPVEGAAIVDKIVWFQGRYNNGYQGDFPCYVVYLADGVRRIITVPMVGLVDVAKVEEKPVVIETETTELPD
jgi:hypothetical protein